ncbi:MAG: cobamide remodeling phosphodiesterase CbiR [bacterium]
MNQFPPLPFLSRNRSFRLGVTSYVHPADITANVRALAPFVDDIELVFFESHDLSTLPKACEIEELRQLAITHDLTYTIHFPTDKALGSPNREERENALSTALHIIELCRPLTPYGWILHIDGIEPTASPIQREAWHRNITPLLRVLAGIADDPTRICVENLGYPFEWCDPILTEMPFSTCLDFGHLLQMNYDWRDHVNQWLQRTRIIHLYGSNNTSRHYSLELTPAPLVQEFLKAIKFYNGVLTLETFGYDDTVSSIKRLEECL